MRVNANSSSANHTASEHWRRWFTEVHSEHQHGEEKGDLSDFERGMVVVGARRAGLSISQTADPLGFSTHSHLWDLERTVLKKRENIKRAAAVVVGEHNGDNSTSDYNYGLQSNIS